VVESDSELLDLYSQNLVRFGCQVTRLSQPVQALEKIKESNFDVVVLAQGLEGMDGVTLARHLHRHDPELPIILLCSACDTLVANQVQRAVLFEIVLFLCRIVKLEDAVERAIEFSRRRAARADQKPLVSQARA